MKLVLFVFARLCCKLFRLCSSPSQDIEDALGRGAVDMGAPSPPCRIEMKLVSFVCARYVLDCAINLFVSASPLPKILRILFFWREEEIREPPPCQIKLKLVSIVCAQFVLNYAVNLFVCAAPLPKILRILFLGGDTRPPILIGSS